MDANIINSGQTAQRGRSYSATSRDFHPTTMGRPNTSCNECQRQRLGCNALLQPGRVCYNCFRRGLACSITPKRTATNKRRKARQVRDGQPVNTGSMPTPAVAPMTVFDDSPESDQITHEDSPALDLFAPGYTTSASLSRSSDSLARLQQASRLHHLLWNVFTTVLEPRIGLWIGGRACPFAAPNPVRLFKPST